MEAAEKGEIFYIDAWDSRGLNFDLEHSSLAELSEVTSVTTFVLEF